MLILFSMSKGQYYSSDFFDLLDLLEFFLTRGSFLKKEWSSASVAVNRFLGSAYSSYFMNLSQVEGNWWYSKS